MARHVVAPAPSLVEVPQGLLGLEVLVGELDAGGRRLQQRQQRQHHAKRDELLDHGVLLCSADAVGARASSKGGSPFILPSAMSEQGLAATAGGPGPQHTDQGESK